MADPGGRKKGVRPPPPNFFFAVQKRKKFGPVPPPQNYTRSYLLSIAINFRITEMAEYQCIRCPVVSIVSCLRHLVKVQNLPQSKDFVLDTVGGLLNCLYAIWPRESQEFCRNCGTHGNDVRSAMLALWKDILDLTMEPHLVNPIWVAIHDCELKAACMRAAFQTPIVYLD